MASAFSTAVDIANRALQHCGATRIAAFTDDTKNAAAVSFVYDKLREAELRRNVWRFAIRNVALRPIDPTTKTFVFTTYPTDYAGPDVAQLYDSTIVYWSGELVYNTVGPTTTVYQSRMSSNDQPLATTSAWRVVAGTLSDIEFDYPLGSGPTTQEDTRNVFQLPHGFLREAPQDPKDGSVSIQGAPTGTWYNDWNFQDNYIVSRDFHPLIFRFVANITTVPEMDPMFCEGLGARIALEVVEELTQSAEKLQTITAIYKEFMGEARDVNGIETGSEEPPVDDYIATRY